MKEAISYDYGPVPMIREFSRSDKLIRGLVGPFGSGKSSGCVVEILRRSMAQKPGADGIRRTRWACIRNSYPQLRDTTIKTFKDWVDFDVMGVWRERDHTFTMKFGDVESEVMFRALDRPDDTSNLLSLELTGAWLNEAREIDWAIVQALLGRVGRFPAVKDGGASWYGIIADTNPPDVDSWWFRLFEKEKPDNTAIFRQPSGVADNAENLRNLPRDYYQNLLKMNSQDWCKVHVHGEYGFVQDGKPVFPMYADSVHCTEKAEYIEGLKIYRGWDFGLTPAISLSHLTAEGRWIIFDELVAEDVGIDRFADRVIRTLEQKYPGARYVDVGDPAGQQRAQTDERSCFDLLYAKGIKISGGEQSLVIRIESIRKALNSMIDGKPQFALHPRCDVLRKGFLGKYRYRKLQAADRFSEDPEKNAWSHVNDSLQYVGTRLFGGALRTIISDEKPDRYRRKRGRDEGSWLAA